MYVVYTCEPITTYMFLVLFQCGVRISGGDGRSSRGGEGYEVGRKEAMDCSKYFLRILPVAGHARKYKLQHQEVGHKVCPFLQKQVTHVRLIHQLCMPRV